MKQKSLSAKRCFVFAALVGIILIVALFPGAYAMYLRSSGEVNNTFRPAASVDPPVEETFEPEGTVKSDVRIAVDTADNPTEYPVCVRAAVVITWQRTENDLPLIYYVRPEPDTDYSIEFNDTDWTFKDGYYYYNYIVPSGGKTSNLINKCTALKSFTDVLDNTYTLSVDIIPQTVQAIGFTDDGSKRAVEDAWGLTDAPDDYAGSQDTEP